jgi:hypothetical protein
LLAVLVVWLALTSACSESCRSSVSARVESLDGAYVAEVEDEICDSGRRSRYVFLLRRADAERVLVLDVGAKLQANLSWNKNGTAGLTIGIERMPSGSRTVPKVTTILGVPVTITDG